MDPSKSASAPPMEYRGEKSSVGQMPPPAYQDTTYPGHPRPGYNPLQPQGFGPPPPYGGEGYGPHRYIMGQQHPGQPTIVQPTVYVARGPLVNPVNDYLCYSIFTLFCCMPLGIAALIFSISTREANHAGDQMQAERSSKTARTLNHVALGIGLGFFILSIVFAGVLASDF
ncbi:proline-rich transmembrane 1-like [Solea senegalensis]|uniref:Proline-rich transmembrane 1-like n=1 Tax=Solea senegalensis TaxID=28829 RepID=A0AAV6PTP5_SOLSE|nr:proline-rich transmembrane 1-like [Solea senegalensis]